MLQGVNKEYIFKNKEYIESYLNIVNENIIKYELTIIAYFNIPQREMENLKKVIFEKIISQKCEKMFNHISQKCE